MAIVLLGENIKRLVFILNAPGRGGSKIHFSFFSLFFFFFWPDPLTASEVKCVLPAAFLMLEKTKMLENPGCLSAFSRAEDFTDVASDNII